MSTPPAVEVNFIADSFVPWVLTISIVSDDPTFVVNEIALASSVLDDNVNWPPEIFTSFPADASMSTPPAVEVNFIAASSVPWVFTISIVSDDPTFVVNEIALASSVFDDNVNWPPEIFTSFPTDASISTPPAVEVNFIADSFVPWVFTISIVSDDPTFVVNEIALASSVFDDNVNWPPEIFTSLPAAASISNPPATDSNLIADSDVPWLLVISIVSFSPLFVVNEIALTSLVFDVNVSWPPVI